MSKLDVLYVLHFNNWISYSCSLESVLTSRHDGCQVGPHCTGAAATGRHVSRHVMLT